MYINPDGKIWTDSFRGRENAGLVMSSSQVKQIILNVSALTNQLVTEEKSALDAEIPQNEYFDKCRFKGNLLGIVLSPTLNIRKHQKKIFTLDDYVTQEILTERQRKIIIQAIHDRKNIIAEGGTKSGTTDDTISVITQPLSRMENLMSEPVPKAIVTIGAATGAASWALNIENQITKTAMRVVGGGSVALSQTTGFLIP